MKGRTESGKMRKKRVNERTRDRLIEMRWERKKKDGYRLEPPSA